MTLVFGHRGAKGEAPENTIAAFQACLQQGVQNCELDLRLSKDNIPMVVHDASLKRTTGRNGLIKNKTAAQLAEYDASFCWPRWLNHCPIPSLEQVFVGCEFKHWQLEIKPLSRKKTEVMLLAIEQLAVKYQLTDQITITSSSSDVLKAARQLAPSLKRGLVSEYASLDPIKVALRYECSMLALAWPLCTASMLKKAKNAGLHVSVWTVNEPAFMRRLVELGADSLITDFPGLASATLASC